MSTELSLASSMDELQTQLIKETDPDELKNIIDLFNLNIHKKDLLRSVKIDTLQDKIVDQIEKRMDKYSGEFSNKDLIDYFKLLSDSKYKSSDAINSTSIPVITYNNQVNINMEDSFDRDARKRILDAVNAIVADVTTDSEDVIEE